MALPGEHGQVERPRGRGEKTKRIVMGALDAVGVHDLVGACAAEPQRQVVSRRVRVVEHGPFMQPEAVKLGGVRPRTRDEVTHVAHRVTAAGEKRLHVQGHAVGARGVIAPLGMGRRALR